MQKLGLPLRKTEQHFTYKDYRSWPDDERWELIDGVAYLMSSPTTAHQTVQREIFGPLYNFLKGKPCRVFAAPLDVFFPRLREQNEDDVDTVVQPDLVVVCDPDKIRNNGIWTAPDLIVEILSPSTSRKDQNEKYRLYERSGVREYWVVDPLGKWLQQYSLRGDGTYEVERTFESGTLESSALPGLVIDVAELWEA
jgi:Uma2 family endonuclease